MKLILKLTVKIYHEINLTETALHNYFKKASKVTFLSGEFGRSAAMGSNAFL